MKKNSKIGNWKIKLVSLLVLSLTLSNFNAIMVKAAENDTYAFEYPNSTSLGSLETTALFAINYTGNHIEGNVVVENIKMSVSIVPKKVSKSIVVNPGNYIGQTNTQDGGAASLVVVGNGNEISKPDANQIKVNNGEKCYVNGVIFKTMTEAGCNIDFNTAKEGLVAFSEQLYSFSAGEYNDGKLLVVDCDVAELQKDTGNYPDCVKNKIWNDYVNKYDAVIINVKASGSVEYKGIGGQWDTRSSKILWNFGKDVTNLSIKDISSGTILAPNAKVQDNGQLNGSLFVSEFIQSGEIHQLNYNGLLPKTGSNNTTSGNTTSGSATSGNTTSGNTTSGNTTSGNTTSGNTTSGNTTSGNTTSGNTTSGNTTSGNTTSGNTTSGNTTSGNTTSGNTTSGNTASGNTTSGNTTSGNTTSGNTTSGNTTSGNTTSGNTTSGNTTSGNTTSGNTTSGNTTSGNTTSGNTTSGNTTSGNTTSNNTTSGNVTNNTTNNVTTTTTNTSVNTPNDQGVLGADRGSMVTIEDGEVALSDQGVLGADRLPQTGDTTFYWEIALVAALAGLGLLGAYYKKSEKIKK